MSIELMPNGVEYTMVRVMGKGAIPIGHDIVYPPLSKPPTKEEFEGRGVELTTKTTNAERNLNYHNKMVREYKDSLTRWTRVVSRDPNRGIDNRPFIEFYKTRKLMIEKDSAEVKKYYSDLELKKKQQKT